MRAFSALASSSFTHKIASWPNNHVIEIAANFSTLTWTHIIVPIRRNLPPLMNHLVCLMKVP